MEKLYIKTKAGKIPIQPEIVEKYQLEKGMKAPMTQGVLVNEAGDDTRSQTLPPVTSQSIDDASRDNDEQAELENGLVLKTSEIIDFSQGQDTYLGQK